MMPLRSETKARPSVGPMLWCSISQVPGKHETDNCLLLQNFVQTPQQLFCNFYKSIGNEENNCQSYDLMMDRTPSYKV